MDRKPSLIHFRWRRLIGLISAYMLMVAVYWLFRDSARRAIGSLLFRRLQLISAGALSFRTVPMTRKRPWASSPRLLVSVRLPEGFPGTRLGDGLAHAAIALGTLSGGWRIVHTMGGRLTRLKPRSGFCAETGAAGAVLLATHLGLPVSTTHVIAGAITGVGTIQRMKAVRWGIAGNIVWAWVLTIPFAALLLVGDPTRVSLCW